MDEEQKNLPSPPRFRYKLIKILTLTVLFLALFFVIGFTGLEATSSSKFCSSCHEMKPEFYTWKASTHSEVDCVNCHIEPGAKNLAKDKANGLLQAFKKATNTYSAPIQMPKDIPNSTCERCHNIGTRDVTPSGDLIIPHDKHLAKDIKCIQCHSGVAHGKIAQRNVTFKTDYDKWDDTLGKSMMSDVKFTSPKMETCMECHEARGISTKCTTCHTTGMVPKSHKQKNFKYKNHGSLAKKDVKQCNSCHQYMSDKDIPVMEEVPASEQFLGTGTVKKTPNNVQEYTKENTFCKACHTKRPPSHGKSFVSRHGGLAKQSTKKCLTCHDYQKTGFNKTNNVTCSSCHPASHEDKDFRATHPILLPQGQKPVEMCYTCHNRQKCESCHKQ
ncbi:cytochrome c3 family protein [Neobacillus terrae]|uniref:cytochrome c3 family protein n=1 Tax=Neobacillus terrae TaxID=3034837 RepID=UPI00140DEBCC|nr:NapC/NirT family cytochrome c [Neobacillus terrae]NHM29944.1 cytochrome C [Neobacillus terrae]